MHKRFAAALLVLLLGLSFGCRAQDPALSAPTGDSAQSAAAPTPFSLIWCSDVQHYAESYPETLDKMTEWIAKNAASLNARYVIATGDFVNHRDAPEEWKNADRAFSMLDGVIPLFAVAGNHDIDGHDAEYDPYSTYFGEERFGGLPGFGGMYEDGVGRYDLLDVGDARLLLVGIGYGADGDAIDWVNEILAKYPERAAILCLHSYLTPEGAYTTDGKALLSDVVSQNANVRLVLCGHRHGFFHAAVAFDENCDGTPERVTQQLLSDYQDEPEGGGGYLSILTFDPAANTLRVTAYSPRLDDYNLYDEASGLETFTLPFAF